MQGKVAQRDLKWNSVGVVLYIIAVVVVLSNGAAGALAYARAVI